MRHNKKHVFLAGLCSGCCLPPAVLAEPEWSESPADRADRADPENPFWAPKKTKRKPLGIDWGRTTVTTCSLIQKAPEMKTLNSYGGFIHQESTLAALVSLLA